MADSDSNKPRIYELLSRLNTSFGRVFSNLSALKQTGVFTPQTIERLENLSNELRSDSNFHLLAELSEIEQRDWAAYGQLHKDEPQQIN